MSPVDEINLVVTLDGVSLPLDNNFVPFHQKSTELQYFTETDGDNIFGIPQGEVGAVIQEGYYMALEPLSPGTHHLTFGEYDLTGQPLYGASDTINVVPETSTWGMMLIGFAGLGFS